MDWWQRLLIAAGITAALYLAFVMWLLLAGRRQDVHAVAGAGGPDRLSEHWPGPAHIAQRAHSTGVPIARHRRCLVIAGANAAGSGALAGFGSTSPIEFGASTSGRRV